MQLHRVYFYEQDSSLMDPIAEFVKKGLEQQETVIVIATDQRRFDLKTRLVAANVIGLGEPHDDQYVTLDASNTLSLFMRNGWPDDVFSLVSWGKWSDQHKKIPRYAFTKKSRLCS